MKSQRVLAAVAIWAVFTARLVADDPSKNGSTEQANPPAGRLTVVAPDWTGPINTGQFLAAIAFSNQLGIEVAPVEPPLRAHLDLKEGQGVVVTSAAGESESGTDGLKPHDIVLSIDGHEISSAEKFHELAGSRQGKEAVLHVVRKTKPLELKVAFPNRPVYQFAQLADQLVTNNTASWIDNQYRIGVTLAQADDVLRSQLRLADGEGLVITEVVADGPSAKAGMRKHDVLVKLEGKRLTTVEAFNSQIQEFKDRQVVATLLRGGKEMSVELKPQLSTTAEWTVSPMSAIMFNNALAVDQNQLGRLNLNVPALDSIHVRPVEVHWHSDLRKFPFHDPAASVTPADTTATASTAEQIAQLKQQLAEMQKSLSALETTLQTAKPEQPSKPDQQPAEQKPQQTIKPQP
jgi:membrane-associated protease RseP (regulator of RpoE activity)